MCGVESLRIDQIGALCLALVSPPDDDPIVVSRTGWDLGVQYVVFERCVGATASVRIVSRVTLATVESDLVGIRIGGSFLRTPWSPIQGALTQRERATIDEMIIAAELEELEGSVFDA